MRPPRRPAQSLLVSKDPLRACNSLSSKSRLDSNSASSISSIGGIRQEQIEAANTSESSPSQPIALRRLRIARAMLPVRAITMQLNHLRLPAKSLQTPKVMQLGKALQSIRKSTQRKWSDRLSWMDQLRIPCLKLSYKIPFSGSSKSATSMRDFPVLATLLATRLSLASS